MIPFRLNQIPVQILYVLSVMCIKESFSIGGKVMKNVNDYKIVYPIKVSDADQINSRQRRWENGEESTVHYQLMLGESEEFIDLEPNYHILSPGAVLERRTNATSDNEPLANVELEKPSLSQCFFNGKVRNYDDSSTALSTCGGLYGFIRVKRRTFFITPVAKQDNETDEKQPHFLYEDEENDITGLNCATMLKRDMDNNSEKLHHQKKNAKHLNPDGATSSNSTNKRLNVETLLVLDRSMMDLHDENDLQNYALTVFNMAQTLFHDLSTNPPIDLEVVRIIEVEDPKDILNFRQIRGVGTKELHTFSSWQHRINPKDEKHPNHHDIAILLTGNEICDDEGACHYVGVAETGGACRPKKQAAICKDTGLMLGYIIAHQIAHTLGVDHDRTESGHQNPEGNPSVMSPTITLSPRVWSEQSRDALLSAIKKRQLDCLEDEPTSEFKVTDILPGVMYDADYQCQQLLSPDAISCTKNGDCQSLSCEFDGTSCSNTGVMPAQGTTCDLNKWCYDGVCLEAGKRPLAVQGNWGSWSEWSRCSRTCGAGVSMSTRECNSPPPMHGGKSCSGSRSRHKICTTEPCDVESQPFRDVQCAEYNDWIFPEDGMVHKWKGFFISNGNPCALYCRNENNVVVSLSPKVKDGTTCYRGMRDICVDGICRDIPCDLQFDSNSVEDACGICHGNGTACDIVQGKKNFEEGTSRIIAIPSGTRNIIIEETKQTPSHLTIKTQEKDNVVNEGRKLGMFNASGSIGWLGMKKPNQEILEIPGPLVKPVEIWISSDGPQSVTYSMGLPSSPREGKYSWDYIDWSECMAQCGDSFQESVPRCVELLSGHVEDKYCSQIQKPLVKRRSCNAGICLPRWLVGEWQECGPCPSKEARRFRIVRCIKPAAGSQEGMTIISDKICPGSRPIGSESCRCIKRQVLYWPAPYRFDMFSKKFKILPKMKKGNKSSKLPEKKVTLMQLENENEESMLKQFKENQQKHHSIFYMPHVLGSRFNFSIPFKKREAKINRMPSLELPPLFNNNFINYLPKPNIMDYIKASQRIMGNNYAETTHSTKHFSITDPRNNILSLTMSKLRPIPTNDPPPLRFSDQNVLKLLSENLPLDRLIQQQYLIQQHSNKYPYQSLVYFPDVLLNSTVYGQPKEEKKLDIMDFLMNEFNNVLATNTLAETNSKKAYTTDISPMIKIANKPRDSVLEKGIIARKQPSFLPNTSKQEAVMSPLDKSKPSNKTINESDGLKNSNVGNLGLNNQRVAENGIPLDDYKLIKFISTFKKYFLKKQPESQQNAESIINDSGLPKIDEKNFLISTPSMVSNINNFYPFQSLTKKVAEKFNSLSNTDKLIAYQILAGIVSDLHQTLSELPCHEQGLNEVYLNDNISSYEIQQMPIIGDSFRTKKNQKNLYNILNDVPHIYEDQLRYNQSRNNFINYSLPIFDKQVSSADNLVKMKPIYESTDKINRNEIPEFHQLKEFGTKTKISNDKSTVKSKNDNEVEEIPKATNNSIVSHYLDEFIMNIIGNNQKGDNGRNKKEIAVEEWKPLHKGRKVRYLKICEKSYTTSRRKITGIYPIPLCRICQTTTPTRTRPNIDRCRKDIADLQRNEKVLYNYNNLFEKGKLELPRKIRTYKSIARKKRLPKSCEESTLICAELKKRFKDKLVNMTKLDPYQCQRLREEIEHVKKNLISEKHLDTDLEEIINSNVTCVFRYSDEKETTTPFFFKYT